MKSLIWTALVATGLAVAGSAAADPELAKKSGCAKCHDATAKKVGPTYKDIAAKYKGNASAEGTLSATISAGKDHPEVKASADDVKKIVGWVLKM